jgi:hypothetical protein
VGSRKNSRIICANRRNIKSKIREEEPNGFLQFFCLSFLQFLGSVSNCFVAPPWDVVSNQNLCCWCSRQRHKYGKGLELPSPLPSDSFLVEFTAEVSSAYTVDTYGWGSCSASLKVGSVPFVVIHGQRFTAKVTECTFLEGAIPCLTNTKTGKALLTFRPTKEVYVKLLPGRDSPDDAVWAKLLISLESRYYFRGTVKSVTYSWITSKILFISARPVIYCLNLFHLWSTREQSNIGFPKCSFTVLWASHIHWLNSFWLCTRGGCPFIISSKSFAQ